MDDSKIPQPVKRSDGLLDAPTSKQAARMILEKILTDWNPLVRMPDELKATPRAGQRWIRSIARRGEEAPDPNTARLVVTWARWTLDRLKWERVVAGYILILAAALVFARPIPAGWPIYLPIAAALQFYIMHNTRERRRSASSHRRLC